MHNSEKDLRKVLKQITKRDPILSSYFRLTDKTPKQIFFAFLNAGFDLFALADQIYVLMLNVFVLLALLYIHPIIAIVFGFIVFESYAYLIRRNGIINSIPMITSLSAIIHTIMYAFVVNNLLTTYKGAEGFIQGGMVFGVFVTFIVVPIAGTAIFIGTYTSLLLKLTMLYEIPSRLFSRIIAWSVYPAFAASILLSLLTPITVISIFNITTTQLLSPTAILINWGILITITLLLALLDKLNLRKNLISKWTITTLNLQNEDPEYLGNR